MRKCHVRTAFKRGDGQRHYTTCSWSSRSVGGREYDKLLRVKSGQRPTVGTDKEREVSGDDSRYSAPNMPDR